MRFRWRLWYLSDMTTTKKQPPKRPSRPLYARVFCDLLDDLAAEAEERNLSVAQLLTEILARRYERPTGPVRT